MGKPQRKAQSRLDRRRNRSKKSGNGYKTPGSQNPHKTAASGKGKKR